MISITVEYFLNNLPVVGVDVAVAVPNPVKPINKKFNKNLMVFLII